MSKLYEGLTQFYMHVFQFPMLNITNIHFLALQAFVFITEFTTTEQNCPAKRSETRSN